MNTRQISRADLHIHSTYSDGTADVVTILAQAAAANLTLIAITDHDTIVGACIARQLAHNFGVEVVVGEEVSTADGFPAGLPISKESLR